MESVIGNRCLSCFDGTYDSNTGICPICHSSYTFSNQDHQLVPGSVIGGRYIIGRALGQGGFGITYIGWDFQDDCKVAIKEYYPSSFVSRKRDSYTISVYAGDENERCYNLGLKSFLREAECLKNIGTVPNVVRVKAYFQENSTAYIVMDYVEGITLKKYLSGMGEKTTLADIMEKLHSIVTALSMLHSNNIIHRDISPDNIVLSHMGAVLIDFGSARSFSSELNTTKTVNLKSSYAPIEQYDSHGNQGPWTDVYAFASTIYRAITGILPPSVMDRTENPKCLRPVREFAPEITQGVEDVILKGMSLSAKDRYQSISSFYNDLMIAQSRDVTVIQLPSRYNPKTKEKKEHSPKKIFSIIMLTSSIYILLALVFLFAAEDVYVPLFTQQLFTLGVFIFSTVYFFKKEKNDVLNFTMIEKLLLLSLIISIISVLAFSTSLGINSDTLFNIEWFGIELHIPLQAAVLIPMHKFKKKHEGIV